MPGLIHEHQYQADKAAITRSDPAMVDVFDAIEWALLRYDVSTLPVVASGSRTAWRYATPGTELVPSVVVVLGEEVADGETKIVLLAARVATPVE